MLSNDEIKEMKKVIKNLQDDGYQLAAALATQELNRLLEEEVK